MQLPISLTFAGAFALINLWLAYRCVQVRLHGPGGVGDLGIPALKARMRAHSNFVEYTPFVLILMALIEYSAGSLPWLGWIGGVYGIGRIVHALGMERPKFTLQLLGAVTTWTVLGALAIWSMWLVGGGRLASYVM